MVMALDRTARAGVGNHLTAQSRHLVGASGIPSFASEEPRSLCSSRVTTTRDHYTSIQLRPGNQAFSGSRSACAIAKETGITRSTVHRVFQLFGLQLPYPRHQALDRSVLRREAARRGRLYLT